MQEALNILIVDDDAVDRLTVRRALQRYHESATIQEAATCAEATEALMSRHFDCVFLDQHLPDSSGMACLIDTRKAGVTAPVIVLTGYDDESLAVEMMMAGATDYLVKSEITSQLLGHCLRSALRHHQSQEQIKRGHEALELRDRAIAAASNGIVICDPHQSHFPIIYCNPAFSSITGYPPEEVLGRNCRFIQGKETEEQHIQQVRKCLREERECQVVLRNFKKDGTPWWNELTISPVRDAGGRLTHFIGVQTDITERRNAEEAVRQGVLRQQAFMRDMFASVTNGRLTLCATEGELPALPVRFADPVPLSRAGGIRELRRHTVSACKAAGFPEERLHDLETAVGEAAMNAVVHAGQGLGHVFIHESGTVQVRVEDEGKGIAMEDLPNAPLRRGYTTAGTMGHGFKMILMIVDRVHLLTGAAGTTVVIEQDRLPFAPELKM